VLPLLARYLGTSGIDLAGYSIAAEREEIDLDHVTNVAARFFYPDSIDENGAINAHAKGEEQDEAGLPRRDGNSSGLGPVLRSEGQIDQP